VQESCACQRGNANRKSTDEAAVLIIVDKRMSVEHTYAPMKRTTVWLTEQQIAKLNKLSKHTGLPVAELIRRFIDDGMTKKEGR
jgi:hypothetical protein